MKAYIYELMMRNDFAQSVRDLLTCINCVLQNTVKNSPVSIFNAAILSSSNWIYVNLNHTLLQY